MTNLFTEEVNSTFSTLQSGKFFVLTENTFGIETSDFMMYIYCNTNSKKKPCLKDIEQFIEAKNKIGPSTIGVFVSKLEPTSNALVPLEQSNSILVSCNKSYNHLLEKLISTLHSEFSIFTYDKDGDAFMLH